MIRAFLFVAVRSWKNRIVSRLKRLREPRYLFSAIFAVLYFWFVFLRKQRQPPASVFSHMPDAGLDVMAVFVVGVALLIWIAPNTSSLIFSEGEIHFLFAAPVTRRQLLFYKLLRAQPQVVTGMVILLATRMPARALIGIWLFSTLLSTYSQFVQMARAWLRERRINDVALFFLVLFAAGGIAAMLFKYGHRPVGGNGRVFDAPPTAALLYVPRFVAQMVFSRSYVGLAIHAPFAVAAIAALFLLASALPVTLDEATREASERQRSSARRVRGPRPGMFLMVHRIPPPFRLRQTTPPEVAICWKNAIACLRISGAWLIIVAIVALAIFIPGYLAEDPYLREVLAMASLFVAAAFVVVGPKMFAQDVRLDIARTDVLKSWPISGDRLVAAEMAAPLAIVSMMELLLLAGATGLVMRADDASRFAAAPKLAVVALLFAVPLCAAQLLILNAVPIFFPGWAMRSKEDQRGFMAIGQRLFMLTVNAVALVVFLLPAAIASFLGLWLTHRFGGPLLLAAATMPGVAILCVELWLGVQLLGRRFDELDPTLELEPTG